MTESDTYALTRLQAACPSPDEVRWGLVLTTDGNYVAGLYSPDALLLSSPICPTIAEAINDLLLAWSLRS